MPQRIVQERKIDSGFVTFSAALGNDPTLVQAGGGNTSFKEHDIIWVKASGKWLCNADREPMFIVLDRERAVEIIQRGEVSFESAVLESVSPGLRPSIETSMHVLIPSTIVAHVHSVGVLAWATRIDGRERLTERLAGIEWAWVDYVQPGFELMAAISRSLNGNQKRVFVLANHGLVVCGDTCEETFDLLQEVEKRVYVQPCNTPPADMERLARLAEACEWSLPRYPLVHIIGLDPAAFSLAEGGSLYPDHAVFLGPGAPVCRSGETVAAAIERYRAEWGIPPRHVVVEGVGVLVSRDISAGAEEMLRCLALVAQRVDSTATCRYLHSDEVATLLDWEAERYRQSRAHS